MGKFDFLFSKFKKEENVIDSTMEEIEAESETHDILKEAEKAAAIIDEGIENGDFSGMCDQLEELPSSQFQRDRYVFERPRSDIYIAMIAIFGVSGVAYLYFVLIGLGTAVLSQSYRMTGLGILLGAAVIIAFNALVVKKSISRIKFGKRYDEYLNILKYKNVGLVDDLAAYAKVTCGEVVSDLKSAVEKKWIPQGHFGKDDLFFLVSDEAYDKYMEKRAVYDRYYRKMTEERERMKERTKEIAQILDAGQTYVDKIKDCNTIIKDKVISEKLDRMENVVKMIFHEVDINPANADKLGMFMNYYLPTTEKLLETYIDLDEKKTGTKSIQKMKMDIGNSLDTINRSFEGILEQFYQEQELDVLSDISAMEIMMKQEGLQEE